MIQIEAQDTNFPVCQKAVVGATHISQNSASYIMKTTSCCKKLKALQYNCAIDFSNIVDNNYKVGQKKYEGDQHIKLFCMKCNVKCFLCTHKHHIHFGNVNILVCILFIGTNAEEIM